MFTRRWFTRKMLQQTLRQQPQQQEARSPITMFRIVAVWSASFVFGYTIGIVVQYFLR